MLHSIKVNPYLNQQDACGSGLHGQKFCIQCHPNTQSNFTIRRKPNSPFGTTMISVQFGMALNY